MSDYGSCVVCGKPTMPPNCVLTKGQSYHLGCALDKLHELEADSKKLREPATCNAGHKSNLPLALWDCPVCTQMLHDRLKMVEGKAGELVSVVLRYESVIMGGAHASWEVVLEKAIREVESALGGKAE